MSISLRRVWPLLLAMLAALAAFLVSSVGSAHATTGDTMLIHVKQASLTDQNCGTQSVIGGHFVINQISPSDAPKFIRVRYVYNGTYHSEKFFISQQTRSVTQYSGSLPAGSTIKTAVALVPKTWSGQFVLSNYLCGSGGGTSSSSSSSSSTSTSSSSTASYSVRASNRH